MDSPFDNMPPQEVAARMQVLRDLFRIALDDPVGALAIAQRSEIPLSPSQRWLVSKREMAWIVTGVFAQADRLYPESSEIADHSGHVFRRLAEILKPWDSVAKNWRAQHGRSPSPQEVDAFLANVLGDRLDSDLPPAIIRAVEECDRAFRHLVAALKAEPGFLDQHPLPTTH